MDASTRFYHSQLITTFNLSTVSASYPKRVKVHTWNSLEHHISWSCPHKITPKAVCILAQKPAALKKLSCVYSTINLDTIRNKGPRLSKKKTGCPLMAVGLFKGSWNGWRQLTQRALVRLVPKWAGIPRGRIGVVVIVLGSIAVVISVVAWVVLPNLLRRMYSYMECAPTTILLNRTPLDKVLERVPYELSMCGALEDPARLLATIITFSHLAYMVAPTSIAAHYLTQIWSGATVVSFVWFLYRWKNNVFARIVTGKSVVGPDRERYLTMDRLSSLGLLILGCMAVSESCGMAVQSILTVGGIGGVATAFAAKDVMGNMLCGVGLQFSRPFSVGDSITAGPVNGQVVEMGFHSTQILNQDKYPIIVPNSFFSSQVIVNKSRVRWRGMAFTLPIRLQDFDKVPSITADVRNMLKEHPKVYLETEMPRCHVTKVGGLSIELTISCNLKPMGTDEFLETEEALLMKATQIILRIGALLGSGPLS